MRRARRYGHPLTLAYLDLDNFKQVNDALGHSGGDDVLRGAAEAITRALRTTDIVARLGGDAFAILLPETDGPTASSVLRKLHGALCAGPHPRGWPLTASVGAVTWRQPPATVDELIRLGDEQMYRTKRGGKNRVEHACRDAHPA